MSSKGSASRKSEVKIFGEAVIGKVAAFECRASLKRKNGVQIGSGECVQEPSEAVIPFEDVFANAKLSVCCETIRKQGDVPLWNHSRAPHSQQLFGRDVELQPPFGNVRAFSRQRGIKRNVGGSQTVAK